MTYKKLMGIMMAAAMAATLTAGCGGSSDSAAEEDTAVYTESAEAEESYAATEEAEETTEAEESADSEGFSLNDVTSDMITAAVYAQNADGDELVLATYDAPSGNTYATLVDATNSDLWTIQITADGTQREDVEAEDGSTVSLTVFSGADVYTGDQIVIGLAEPEDGSACYVYDTNGNIYAGQPLTGDEAVTYLGAAIAVAAQ